jgi:DNA-binding LacI/PurR family transcriptional regulator
MATERLLQLGHRRIAFFTHRPFDQHFSVPDRYAGYERAMRSAGLMPWKLAMHETDWSRPEAGMKFVCDFLSAPASQRPTGIVAYEAFESMRLILMAFKLGMNVPADLSVVTFCEKPVNTGGVPVSTIVIPEVEVGRAALDVLMERVNDRVEHVAPRVVAYHESEGGSDGPPPA